MMKRIGPLLLVFAALVISPLAGAQNISLGVHTGSLVAQDQSSLAYGAHLNVAPYDWAAFRIDFTRASRTGGHFFSSSPALVFYPIANEEFLVGFIGGAGFYKFPLVDTKFGLNFGALADFRLAPQLSVGLETRAHSLFDGPSLWTVLLTLDFHFDAGEGW